MIKVVAEHIVEESRVDEFLEAGKKMVAASVKDPGNVYYTMNKSLDVPNKYTILECWENNDVLQAHMNTPHFKELCPLMGTMLAEDAKLSIYEELY